MGNNRKLQFAVRAALAAAAATAVVPTAWSQTAPAAANESPNAGLEEVVVTGSRITSPNLTAISPITQCRCRLHLLDQPDSRRGHSQQLAHGVCRPEFHRVKRSGRHRDNRPARHGPSAPWC